MVVVMVEMVVGGERGRRAAGHGGRKRTRERERERAAVGRREARQGRAGWQSQWAHARSRARYIHTIPQCGNYHSIAPQGNLRPCVSVSGIPAPVCRLALLQPAREGACFSPGETHALAACGDCAGECIF